MNTRDRFVDRYIEGHTPWVHEKPDFNLIEMVDNWPIHPCKTLDMGCGTGTESIWLAQQGFDVTALDGSPIAIEKAKLAAQEAQAKCHFEIRDFVSEEIPQAPFDFIFDRGFFHSFDTDADRKIVAKKVSSLLTERGLWLTLMANADAPPRESGPPPRSARNIMDAIEADFKLLSLNVSYFGNDQESPPKIWVCLMRKR